MFGFPSSGQDYSITLHVIVTAVSTKSSCSGSCHPDRTTTVQYKVHVTVTGFSTKSSCLGSRHPDRTTENCTSTYTYTYKHVYTILFVILMEFFKASMVLFQKNKLVSKDYFHVFNTHHPDTAPGYLT